MMFGKKGNSLIIIENGRIRTYLLDNKNVWELGRPSGDNRPDIRLPIPTVSRKHGQFRNVDGVWFYFDCKGRNGTFYNGKKITPGLNGRIRPVMLEDGDRFVFGSGAKEIIDQRTGWGLYITKEFNDFWRVIDAREYYRVTLRSGNETMELGTYERGQVIAREDGLAILMGDYIYLIGDMELTGHLGSDHED